MEILCLFIPHLRVQWEVQQHAVVGIGPVDVGAQHAVPLRGTHECAWDPEGWGMSPNGVLYHAPTQFRDHGAVRLRHASRIPASAGMIRQRRTSGGLCPPRFSPSPPDQVRGRLHSSPIKGEEYLHGGAVRLRRTAGVLVADSPQDEDCPSCSRSCHCEEPAQGGRRSNPGMEGPSQPNVEIAAPSPRPSERMARNDKRRNGGQRRRLKEGFDPALIIGGFPHERKTVLDCSEQAAASGVHPGMTLRQAHHRCPKAVFLPVDKDAYAQAFEKVLDILDRFSPIVEADSLGKAFLDITGTERLFGPAAKLAEQISQDVFLQTGFKSQVGVAGSKFVAGIAASLASASPLIVRNGEEKRFLEALSVELLPVSQEAMTWLKRLGLRRMGQVASLVDNALASQLGREGLTAHRLANGIDKEPVRPRPRPDILEGMVSFEAPSESLDSLLTAIDKLLDRLVPLLRKRYQVCSQIRLCFCSDDAQSWSDIVNLKTPMDSKPEILGILKRHLETASFPKVVSEIYLGLAKLGSESSKQASLSSGTKRRQEEALQRLEKDLGDRFGHNSLKKVVAVDPDSRIPERRVALVDAHTDG
jgi:nucleotidyltransferase/DNA polymerase involved in DNA repair